MYVIRSWIPQDNNKEENKRNFNMRYNAAFNWRDESDISKMEAKW